MTRHLVVTVRLLDGRFHGRGDRGRREWPPSPMRLFQAIVAGVKPKEDDARWRALQWLERLDPPLVHAPADTQPGGVVLSYVPNNNTHQTKNQRTGKLIAPTLLPTRPTVRYVWSFEDACDCHALVVKEAVGHLRAFGWGIDMAVGHGEVTDTRPALAHGEDEFRPVRPGGEEQATLRVPTEGSMRSLDVRHRALLSRIGEDNTIDDRRRPPVYERRKYVPTVPQGDFHAFRLDARPGYRLEEVSAVVAMFRHLMADAVRKEYGDKLANKVVLGHAEELCGPRISFLPLPSIGHPHVDGRIRRILIARRGEVDRKMWSLLPDLLHGRALEPVGLIRPAVIASDAGSDSVFKLYIKPSRAWASITPMVLPGHDVRKQNKGDFQKQLARAEHLVKVAMKRSGIDAPASLGVSRVCHWPQGLHAQRHLPRRKLAACPRWHVRLEFDRPVNGPLAIGPGMHTGFGTFAAVAD